MREQGEITRWIEKERWDLFITLTFDKKYNDTHILNIMDDIESHYLIKSICWFREFTSTGLPHIHMIVKTTKLLKSIRTLPKHLKRWGQVDFQLFRESQKTEGINYISKL